MTHRIVVTANDVPVDAHWTARQTAVVESCDGDGCALWVPCNVDYYDSHSMPYPAPKLRCDGEYLYTDNSDYVAHGLLHRMIRGRWMLESDLCLLQATDTGHDRLIDFTAEVGPGNYDVTPGSIWCVEAVAA